MFESKIGNLDLIRGVVCFNPVTDINSSNNKVTLPSNFYLLNINYVLETVLSTLQALSFFMVYNCM